MGRFPRINLLSNSLLNQGVRYSRLIRLKSKMLEDKLAMSGISRTFVNMYYDLFIRIIGNRLILALDRSIELLLDWEISELKLLK